MRSILDSGELWGHPPAYSDLPAVQAYAGSLPPNRSGFEFFSLVAPDSPYGPVSYWRERKDGGVRIEDGLAKVKILISRVDQDF